MTSNIYKNEIRVALIKYHQEIINLLQKYPEGYTLHEFNTELELFADSIKLEFRPSDSKNSIRKALKGAKKALCNAAHDSIREIS